MKCLNFEKYYISKKKNTCRQILNHRDGPYQTEATSETELKFIDISDEFSDSKELQALRKTVEDWAIKNELAFYERAYEREVLDGYDTSQKTNGEKLLNARIVGEAKPKSKGTITYSNLLKAETDTGDLGPIFEDFWSNLRPTEKFLKLIGLSTIPIFSVRGKLFDHYLDTETEYDGKAINYVNDHLFGTCKFAWILPSSKSKLIYS